MPHTISSERPHTIYLRVRRPLEKCSIRFGTVLEKKLSYVFPAEMVTLTVQPKFLENFHGDALSVDVVAR